MPVISATETMKPWLLRSVVVIYHVPVLPLHEDILLAKISVHTSYLPLHNLKIDSDFRKVTLPECPAPIKLNL